MPEVETFEAVVTDIHEEQRSAGRHRWRMALDQTRFSGERTAGVLEAVARNGARLEIPVLGVVENGGEVWHVVEKPLGVGTRVRGRLSESLSR